MQEDYKPYLGDITYVSVGGAKYKRQVVCVANKFGDVIVLGVRHWCPLMREAVDRMNLDDSKHEQGFVDQWGNFMSRKEALHVLKTNGRFIRDEDYLDELYSENLY